VLPIGHKKTIETVKFSPNGKFIITVSNAEGLALLWDAVTGVLVQNFLLPKNIYPFTLQNICFTPDNKFVFIVDIVDGKIDLWSLQTGEIVKSFITNGFIKSFELNGNNLLVLSSELVELGKPRCLLRVFDLQSTKLLQEVQVEDRDVDWIRFSPDGNYFVFQQLEGTVHLYKTGAGEIKTLPFGEVNFSANGKTFSHINKENITIYNLQSAQLERQLSSKDDSIFSHFFYIDDLHERIVLIEPTRITELNWTGSLIKKVTAADIGKISNFKISDDGGFLLVKTGSKTVKIISTANFEVVNVVEIDSDIFVFSDESISN
jgi:WD40 repeat protein